ncbi:hypothetical protein [Bartonella sp. DGB1]|uniref:hypothetical protein n=1 Tax=Bartonella sp. DGB1 TaxID=3239807 RepID=UPI003525CD3D
MKKILYLSIIGLLSFIIAYIVEILLIPYFAQNNLWNSVKQTAPEAIFFKLPENNPIMRTNDPAFEVLTCRFNLNNAPIKIQTKNSDAFWTIAIFNKNGERFFSSNKSLNTKENLNYILANPVQIAELNQQKN